MRFQRSWVPALVVGVISLASGGWLLQQSGDDRPGVHASARLLEEIHRLITDRYVERVDPAELYQMAIDGMLYELGDPYTAFLDPRDYENLTLSTTGNYGGLGIRIDSQEGWITVVAVLPGTPAERTGLQVGDRIIEVEGESAQDWSTDRAVSVLRGPKGSKVSITVARVGVDKPLRFAITRDEIHVVAIQTFMLDDRVGYVELTTFSREARDELREALDELKARGAESVILDLRRNQGGLLEEGIAIADIFLPRGAEVLATESRLPDQNQVFAAPGEELYPDLPLVVLVGPYSASASEIVAGALQDHDRALILGTPSFGKGSVQTLYGLSGGNYLKVTTAKWLTPSGRSIQKPRDRQAQLSELVAESISMHGEPVAVEVDTTGREVFHTDAGREVYGGGGITPDLIVKSEVLSTRQQLFRSAVVRQGLDVAGAAFQFGVEWAADHPDLPRDFRVTPAMHDAFYRYLTEEVGAEVDRELYDDSREYVDFLLSVWTANAAFGETAALERRVRRDVQVSESVALLNRARSPQELFALARATEAGGEREGVPRDEER